MMSDSQTLQRQGGPRVRQYSVFLENKVGALLEVVKMLNSHHVQVVALSVQDSTDSSIARMVVSDPDLVEELFHIHDIPFGKTELVVVQLREGADELAKLLSTLLAAEVNIFFIYPLMSRPDGLVALALNVEDYDCACSVMASSGFSLLSQSDISR